MCQNWGTGVAQWVEHVTSTQVIVSPVGEFQPHIWLAVVSTERAVLSPSVPLSLCPSLAQALSFKINKHFKKKAYVRIDMGREVRRSFQELRSK